MIEEEPAVPALYFCRADLRTTELRKHRRALKMIEANPGSDAGQGGGVFNSPERTKTMRRSQQAAMGAQ